MQSAIGIFDSGVGGLTVHRAVQSLLPNEHLLYLGDSARVPYGTKSEQSIIRYALQASQVLVARGVKALVIACNTATAVALPALREAYPDIPVIGVVEPGALAAVKGSKKGEIAVIATESTIAGGAYQAAILALNPDANIKAKACSLFVALAEEGWVEGDLLEAVLGRYLNPLFNDPDHHPDALVLGCTHFPVMKQAIQNVVGSSIHLVDSAETTALWLQDYLARQGLLNEQGPGQSHYLVTDGVARFARVAPIFLGEALQESQIELVDLQA